MDLNKCFWTVVNNFELKDTHWERVPSSETPALTKRMNMDIWVAGTSNELLIRDSYTEKKFKKVKWLLVKPRSLW